MKKLVVFSFVFIFFVSSGISQKVDPSSAGKIAVAISQKHNSGKAVQVSSIVPIGLKNDTLFYVVSFTGKGFILVSGSRAVPPILGESSNEVYDTKRMPPGLLYLLEKYKYGISKLNEEKVLPSKEIEKRWDEILSSDFLSAKSYSVGTWMVKPTWAQGGGYAYYATPQHPIGCTGVAMAQILHYWACRVDGHLNNYMWANMDLYSADLDNALLISDCCLSCETNENHSSTPGKARDGFVEDFGMQSSADVRWRIWHLNQWQGMLEDQIDLQLPILYSGGNISLEGHSWVVDGYNEQGNFHCNWGWSGSYNDFYSLGDFDPGGNGPFNQMESAIFNVLPVHLTGVETPQLAAQSFTYNSNGYTLSVPAAFGATSYEWSTQYGTISGNGSSVTLKSNFSTNVQVRAYNNRCQIYSPYISKTITINYGPISGSRLVCSSGSSYSIPNVPSTASITWTPGPYLTRSSSQGSNPCTFVSSGSGSSWIRATISTNNGSVTLPDYIVWSGKPVMTITGPTEGCPNVQYMFQTQPTGLYSGASNYAWDIYPYNGYISTSNGGVYAYITFYAPYSASGYQVKVRAQNTCGTGNYTTNYVWIHTCSYYLISPNPASETVTITEYKTSSDGSIRESNLEDSNLVSTIRIIDFYGMPIYETTRSGESFTLSIGNLKNGNYIIQIMKGGKTSNLQLIVKH
jgi:hypothetical protein